MSEENHRSLYGISEWTPQERDGFWKNSLKRCQAIRKRHIAIRGDGSRSFPGIKPWTSEDAEKAKKEGLDSFFGIRLHPSEGECHKAYDRLFHYRHGFDMKMHRDDRKSVLAIGRSIHKEEINRIVPVQASSIYGHPQRKPLEPFCRDYVNVAHVFKGFFHKRGTGLPPVQP
ncbi:hypothetical protein ACJMK2_010784 [Sinanodonta woodiana]|uniref:Uncharacterized protein n=1 Tax=Sinanodonta woodiana TaxID=1069815 RepID=A0ABD3VIY4_SINWO